MNLSVYTDGGSKGNPGPASIGIVVYGEGKKRLFHHKEAIGRKTNNEAEYTAVIRALELVREYIGKEKLKPQQINFYSDSLLIVSQLNGLYKIKKPHIRGFIFKIRVLESEIRLPVHYHHIPREKNQVADDLVNGIEPTSWILKCLQIRYAQPRIDGARFLVVFFCLKIFFFLIVKQSQLH